MKSLIAFMFTAAVLVLCAGSLMERQIYNASIRPVLDHAEFISIPGKKYINKEDSDKSIFVYDDNALLHTKHHDDKAKAINCYYHDEKCYTSVKAAEFKGNDDYWNSFLVEGRLPSAQNEIAINELLSKRINRSIGDKAGIFISESVGSYEEKTITGIVKNSYGFPHFCKLSDYICRKNYKYEENDRYFVFGIDMFKNGINYSFSDNQKDPKTDINIAAAIADELEYKQTLRNCYIYFFIISLIANLIALLCINKATSFRQRCNKLIMLGKNRKEVLEEKFYHYVFFICLCLVISPWQNWHFFIVNAIAAIAAVSINVLLGKKYEHS